MGTVNKADLIRLVAEATGETQKTAQAVIEAAIDAIGKRAEAGDTVKIMGFGAFAVKARPARIGRNPKTGEPVDIPETRKVTFKASKKS
jgi:DNA-binding protein HU-beta